MSARSFLDLRLDARVGALLDAGSWEPLEPVEGSGGLAAEGAGHNLKSPEVLAQVVAFVGDVSAKSEVSAGVC